MSKQQPPWEVRVVRGFESGRISGYTVERIHNPGTPDAKAEALERGRVFRTEAEARAAIAKAEGAA